MENKKPLGEFIREVDVRNKDLSVKLLLGVSINKVFIETHANTIGTDFSTYKVVKKGQFAYGPVTSRNGDKISVALLSEADECLVSSSYSPFEVYKKDELNPEYLMLIFRNEEFDRYARYNSWGSAREVFSWEEMCSTMINVPSIDEQNKIVKEIKALDCKQKELYQKKHLLINLATSLCEEFVENPDYSFDYDVSLVDEKFCKVINSGIDKFEGTKDYFATSCVEDDFFVAEGEKIEHKNKPSRANMQPEEFSVWFAKMKNTHKTLAFDDSFDLKSIILSTGFYGLKPSKKYFYYYWAILNWKKFENLKDLQCNGTTQEALNDDGAKLIMLKMPKEEKIEILNNKLKPIFESVLTINRQISLLEKVKNKYLKTMF